MCKMVIITTRQESWAFYLYGAAANPYMYCSLTFIPPYLTTLAQRTARFQYGGEYVYIGSVPVHYASYWTFLTTVSVIIQAFCCIIFGAMSDFGPMRKRVLLATSFVLAAGIIVFIGVEEANTGWLWGGVVAIVVNVLYGLACVTYFAQITVADSMPRVLITPAEDKRKVTTKKREALSNMSDIVGAIGTIALLLVCLVLLLAIPLDPENSSSNSTAPVAAPDTTGAPVQVFPDNRDQLGNRVVIMVTGLWYLAFTIPCLVWIQQRLGPSLQKGEHYLTVGLKRVGRTFRQIYKLPHTFRYLLAFWFISDGIAGIATVAPVFAATEVGMDSLELAIFLLVVIVCAGIGNGMYLFFVRKGWMQAKHVFMLNTAFMMVTPAWALFLTTKWEFYMCGVIYGIQSGSQQSFCRSLMADLTPPGYESEFFGFYEITDKGTSWLAPLVVGVINQATNNFRIGFVCTAAFLVLPLPILHWVDAKQGRIDAIAFAKAHAHNHELHQAEEGKPKEFTASTDSSSSASSDIVAPDEG